MEFIKIHISCKKSEDCMRKLVMDVGQSTSILNTKYSADGG